MNLLHSKARSQLGGTLGGLVFGVLIGLAIALGVALYVNKVPVPFVDRGVTRKPAQDAAEAEHNKGWNPNAGLVGTQEPLPPPVTEGNGGNGPTLLAPGPDTGTPGAATGDPLGDLVRSKLDGETEVAPAQEPVVRTPSAAPAADPAAAQAQPFAYFVQVGAFRSANEAEAQRAKVALMGMAAQITEREQSGRTVYRVRLGPFNQRTMAEATRDQLAGAGVEAALVRVER